MTLHLGVNGVEGSTRYTGATDASGNATFVFRGGSGCYDAVVESVTRDGYTWDGGQVVGCTSL